MTWNYFYVLLLNESKLNIPVSSGKPTLWSNEVMLRKFYVCGGGYEIVLIGYMWSVAVIEERSQSYYLENLFRHWWWEQDLLCGLHTYFITNFLLSFKCNACKFMVMYIVRHNIHNNLVLHRWIHFKINILRISKLY